ncbi:hypothetical protein ACJMK2_029397 [Sinanodonta woodiana]|uniref:LAGLIDADG homing endonuclease n=1 Tax=Sinanodonta woodiana TaxID=1069815 RepID=A0ABD3XA11_SINWO
MSGRTCKRKILLSGKELKLAINMTNCDLTGKTLTVFSTHKHRWNSYIYLDKDDLVLSRQFRHKCPNKVYQTFCKSIHNQHLKVKRVSNSGDTQHIPVNSSVTLRFVLCLVVRIILNTLH